METTESPGQSTLEDLLADAVQLSVVEGVGNEIVDLHEVAKTCSELGERGIKVLIDGVELGLEVGWRFLALPTCRRLARDKDCVAGSHARRKWACPLRQPFGVLPESGAGFDFDQGVGGG